MQRSFEQVWQCILWRLALLTRLCGRRVNLLKAAELKDLYGSPVLLSTVWFKKGPCRRCTLRCIRLPSSIVEVTTEGCFLLGHATEPPPSRTTCPLVVFQSTTSYPYAASEYAIDLGSESWTAETLSHARPVAIGGLP